jgi:hypothetical protein
MQISDYTVQRGPQAHRWLVAALAVCASVAAFLFYFVRGEILLYGDAVAHINIARRVFDARNPGPLQLGTVWLPLPHLLQLPFVVNQWMWQSGVGASIPSMVAYVLGVVGVFRILQVRGMGWSAWVGAAVYGLNPSLLYMQSTAMTESIFLAAMIWAVFYLDEYARGLLPPTYGYGQISEIAPWKALERCGLSLVAGILTRYDGWIFAFVAGMIAVVLTARRLGGNPNPLDKRRVLRAAFSFLLMCALTPALWLAHNYAISKKPLDWFNGPYSAKAIEKRTARPGDPPYPGKNSMKVASQYFLKCARMNMAESGAEKVVFAAVLLGTGVAVMHLGTYGIWLLLWIPLPFYAYSIAYGSVPIFIPVWWPYSYYNVRYGLELLPVFAVMIGVAVWALSGIRVLKVGPVASILLVGIVGAGYASSWRGDSHYEWGVRSPKRGPLCFGEAVVNSKSRLQTEHWLAQVFESQPPQTRYLMRTGEYVGAFQIAGIPLKRCVNESTFIAWDAGLSNPASMANVVVAFDNDEVAQAVRLHPRGLEKMGEFRNSDGRVATIYRSVPVETPVEPAAEIAAPVTRPAPKQIEPKKKQEAAKQKSPAKHKSAKKPKDRKK